MSRIFGQIRQNGYVVRDLEAAMRHWTEKLGVGPCFYLEPTVVDGFTFRGQPSPVEMSLAIVNSGTLQFELIQQHNDAPSMYRDFLDAGHEGLHHLGVVTASMDDDQKRVEQAGYRIAQAGPGFAYYETETFPGSIMELIDASSAGARRFNEIEEAARDWDGRDPIRPLVPGSA
ncbi:MAG: glyoxalase [Deltaproteobacteria bacterium]|nr:glyoxalase [Deltaproteobacteria bacterium]